MKKMHLWLGFVFFVLSLTACDPLSFTKKGKELQGTYVISTTTWIEKITIGENEIRYENGSSEDKLSTTYAGQVEKTVFSKWNGKDTDLAKDFKDKTYSLYGYIVYSLTESSGEGTGKVGEFNVFRFGKTEEGVWAFTQGSKNSSTQENVYINSLFDSAKKAEEMITIANGYFDFSSSGYSKQ